MTDFAFSGRSHPPRTPPLSLRGLGELPVLYPYARHEGGRGVLQGAVFLPFKLPDGEACYGFHVSLACAHTGIDRTEVPLFPAFDDFMKMKSIREMSLGYWYKGTKYILKYSTK